MPDILTVVIEQVHDMRKNLFIWPAIPLSPQVLPFAMDM